MWTKSLSFVSLYSSEGIELKSPKNGRFKPVPDWLPQSGNQSVRARILGDGVRGNDFLSKFYLGGGRMGLRDVLLLPTVEFIL